MSVAIRCLIGNTAKPSSNRKSGANEKILSTRLNIPIHRFRRSTAGGGAAIPAVVVMLNGVVRRVKRLCRDRWSIKVTNSYDEELSFDSVSRRRSNAPNRVLRARMRSVIGRRKYCDGQGNDDGDGLFVDDRVINHPSAFVKPGTNVTAPSDDVRLTGST
jgi:hypothetical protein